MTYYKAHRMTDEELHEAFMEDPYWDIRQQYYDEIMEGLKEDIEPMEEVA